jgi:hypothetical protein
MISPAGYRAIQVGCPVKRRKARVAPPFPSRLFGGEMDLTIKKSEYFLKNPETGKEKDLYEVMGISNTYVFLIRGKLSKLFFTAKIIMKYMNSKE